MSKFLDIRISGEDEEIRELLIILRKIEWCGDVGAGRSMPIYIDGDGSARLSFEYKNGDELKPISELVKLDKKALDKVSDGEDFQEHYIGE
jgi:hypothetical protein